MHFLRRICRNIPPSERKSCETYKTRHRQRSGVNRILYYARTRTPTCLPLKQDDADSVINPVRQQ